MAGLHEQVEAVDRAEARNDWYVIVPGVQGILGPVSEAQARQGVRDALDAGYKPKLLRVTEDYEA